MPFARWARERLAELGGAEEDVEQAGADFFGCEGIDDGVGEFVVEVGGVGEIALCYCWRLAGRGVPDSRCFAFEDMANVNEAVVFGELTIEEAIDAVEDLGEADFSLLLRAAPASVSRFSFGVSPLLVKRHGAVAKVVGAAGDLFRVGITLSEVWKLLYHVDFLGGSVPISSESTLLPIGR